MQGSKSVVSIDSPAHVVGQKTAGPVQVTPPGPFSWLALTQPGSTTAKTLMRGHRSFSSSSRSQNLREKLHLLVIKLRGVAVILGCVILARCLMSIKQQMSNGSAYLGRSCRCQN